MFFCAPAVPCASQRRGELLVGYAGRLLALNRELMERVARPGTEGVVRLGVMQQFGHALLPELLGQFRRAHPGMRLSVEVDMSANLLRGLEEDRFDLVIAAAGPASGSPPGLSAIIQDCILLKEMCVWVQASRSSIDPLIDPLPLVLFSGPCGFRRTASDLLDRAGRTWNPVFTSAGLGSIQAAVMADLGISLLGESSVLPGMRIIPSKSGLPPLPEIEIAVYSRRSPVESRARSLGEFIAKSVQAEPPPSGTIFQDPETPRSSFRLASSASLRAPHRKKETTQSGGVGGVTEKDDPHAQ